MNYLEFIEQPHVFRHEGVALFQGTPDRKLWYPKRDITVVMDFKFGRKEVPNATINLQLRSYVCMEVMEDCDVVQDTRFSPSNMIRRKLCAGSLALESTIPEETFDDSRYAEEGSLLHAHMANRIRARDALTPEQLETLELCEKIEREFLDRLPSLTNGSTYALIIQPRLRIKQYIAEYTKEDIAKAKVEILSIWDRARTENAQRVASAEACQFCKAKAICQEYQEWAFAVAKFKEQPMGRWSAEQWDVFLTRRSELSRYLEEAYDFAKKLKAMNPEALPGWQLKEGNAVRVVSDIVGAWQELTSRSLVTAKQFNGCVQLSLGDLERIIWEAARDTESKLTQKAAKELVNTVLKGAIETRRNKPSLVKEKE